MGQSADDNKIHLVAKGEVHSKAPAGEKSRIEIGEYIADILVDRRSFPIVVHWIVQKHGSADILQWGHEETYEAAAREATAWIESLVRYDEFRRNQRG